MPGSFEIRIRQVRVGKATVGEVCIRTICSGQICIREINVSGNALRDPCFPQFQPNKGRVVDGAVRKVERCSDVELSPACQRPVYSDDLGALKLDIPERTAIDLDKAQITVLKRTVLEGAVQERCLPKRAPDKGAAIELLADDLSIFTG